MPGELVNEFRFQGAVAECEVRASNLHPDRHYLHLWLDGADTRIQAQYHGTDAEVIHDDISEGDLVEVVGVLSGRHKIDRHGSQYILTTFSVREVKLLERRGE